MNKTRYKTNYIVHDNGEVFKITKNGLKKKKFNLWLFANIYKRKKRARP